MIHSNMPLKLPIIQYNDRFNTVKLNKKKYTPLSHLIFKQNINNQLREKYFKKLSIKNHWQNSTVSQNSTYFVSGK